MPETCHRRTMARRVVLPCLPRIRPSLALPWRPLRRGAPAAPRRRAGSRLRRSFPWPFLLRLRPRPRSRLLLFQPLQLLTPPLHPPCRPRRPRRTPPRRWRSMRAPWAVLRRTRRSRMGSGRPPHGSGPTHVSPTKRKQPRSLVFR